MFFTKKHNVKIIAWHIIVLLSFEQLLPSNLPTDLSAFGELLTVQPTPTVQLQYPYGNLNPNYVTTSTLNGGTVTNSTNFAVLSTGTATNGYALLTSKNRLHYQPSQGCTSLFTAIFTTGTAGSSQQIGVGNIVSSAIQDGLFFGYFNGNSFDYNGIANGTYTGTTFGIIHTCNGRTFFYPQSTWNVDNFLGVGGSTNPSGITLDQTKGNVYKLQYQWLGFGAIRFYIENPTTGILTLVHIIQYANANTITTLLNPAMQLMAQVSKTSGASNITLQNPSFAGIIEGYIDTNRDTRNNIANSTTAYTVPAPAGTFNNIISIQNGTTFNGVTNQVPVYPEFISLYNAAATTTEIMFSLYLNPTFATPPTYEPINTITGATTSVVNFASSGTGTGTGYDQVSTVSGGNLLWSTYLVGHNTLLIDIKSLTIQLEPGDVLCLAASRITGTGTVLASLSWHEGF